MRIGVSVKMRKGGYDRFGREKYNKIRSHGFDCVDFDMCNTDHWLYALDDREFESYLLEEKALAEQAGIAIWQTHGPWRVPKDATEADRQERLEKMEKSIRATRILGSRYWVIHPLMPCGWEDMATGQAAETWKINVAFFEKLLPIAAANDVVICLENTPFPAFSLGTPEQVLTFIRHFGSDHLKMCLDTGHVAVIPGLSLADAVRQGAGEIAALHVHDNDGKVDSHLPPYQGVVDWQAFSSALKEIGFDGVLSLEIVPKETLPTEEFERQSKALAQIARKLIP